ncbi:hypothetical protein ABL78_0763 [Leptomonas seymouri]|uniref:Uncharacterized protein n=1 Tax=Leptomonas seymouri TaxID=5684 RepID=A0A0N1I363_LEPSE|nr:hypothetical protein ABL78_0763 [Leptomonas seymouri]|eukprot:KPI90118.1 hypothetical protein ABL78_0763 [Leptomonas seymouri]
MEPPINSDRPPHRQYARGPLNPSDAYGDPRAQGLTSPEALDISLAASNRRSSHEQNVGRSGGTPTALADPPLSTSVKANTDGNSEGGVRASASPPTALSSHLSPPAAAALRSPKVVSVSVVGALDEKGQQTQLPAEALLGKTMATTESPTTAKAKDTAAADVVHSPLVPPPPPPNVLETSAASLRSSSASNDAHGGAQQMTGEAGGVTLSPANSVNTEAKGIDIHTAPTHSHGASENLPTANAAALSREQNEPTPGSTPASSENRSKRVKAMATGSHQKPSHTSVRRALYCSATPTKQKPKRAAITAAQIAELLTGAGGTPSRTLTSDKASKANVSGSLPSMCAVDLPLGLLVLYCAAEDDTSETKNVAATSPASAHLSAAYGLLYFLRQLSDMRRRDRRRAILQQASAAEEAKCKELYETAVKRRNATAALQAARAQEVEKEELEQCTFHPELSPAAKSVAGKGAKDFMAKCLEWKVETERRLKQKYERQVEMEAEAVAMAAAQNGVPAPGEAMTERSRRLLEEPEVQERLKARPNLWEAKKPAAETIAHDPQGLTASLLGAPIGSKVEEEQAAVLHRLRRSDAVGQDASLLSKSDLQRPNKGKGRAVQQFLSRVEEDAARREAIAARLTSRYHNPDMERYEAGTGQQLFTPNAMPTVWKDGRRVGYEDLTEEEQRDFRVELEKAGMGFVLARYSRDQKDRSERQDRDGRDHVDGNSETRDASPHLQSGALTTAQRERFMASLQDAMTRREQNLQRVRAQATAEETFHPRITPRSIRMARQKNGNKPIYERSTVARDVATVSAKSPSKETDAEPKRSLNASHKDRPLPDVAALFLARNEQWSEARQRRLERVAAEVEEKRHGDCTFSPRRFFNDPGDSPVQSDGATEGRGVHAPHPLDSSGEGNEQGRHRTTHARHYQDELATAADVRLMNELELLRSGAAFRDERFVRAVCDRTGVSDWRQAMANLSLQSAPRLSSSRTGASPPSHGGSAAGGAHSSSWQISPIATRSNRPSASPYAAPRHVDPRPEASLPSTYVSQHCVPMMRTESGATQTPTHHHSCTADAYSSRRSPISRANAREDFDDVPPIEDPWAALDAQTDAILKRHGY